MLMPKKVKYRKQQKGKRRGKAWRGSEVTFGEYGLKAMESGSFADTELLDMSGERRGMTHYGTTYQLRNAKISVRPLTWSQLIDRERLIDVHIPNGQTMCEMGRDIIVQASTGGLTIIFVIHYVMMGATK